LIQLLKKPFHQPTENKHDQLLLLTAHGKYLIPRKSEPGFKRALPFLLAANGELRRPFRLTSLEAMAGALVILGEQEQAEEILAKVSWGLRFLQLNEEPLSLYAKAADSSEIIAIQGEFL
jgi:pre-rRNA-processing protein TSR3